MPYVIHKRGRVETNKGDRTKRGLTAALLVKLRHIGLKMFATLNVKTLVKVKDSARCPHVVPNPQTLEFTTAHSSRILTALV